MRQVKQIKAKNIAVFFQAHRDKKIPVIHFHTEIFGISNINTYIDTCTGTHAFVGGGEAQRTEHTHSILATHPKLDGTGLECFSYATLHFNSRRTGQSVFMIRHRVLQRKNKFAFETASGCQSTLIVCLFWWQPYIYSDDS